MADDPMSARLDVRAVQAWRRRLARAPADAEAPWLPQEVARRMHERLTLIRHQPSHWLDASGAAGLGVDHLPRAYPKARGTVLEDDPTAAARLRAAASRPWWRGFGAPPRWAVVGPAEARPDRVGMVWSNLALHWDADPPATLAHWRACVAPGGFVMFSTLGPDTLRELRALYRVQGWGAMAADPVDMHDLGDMLAHAGFADPVMDQEVLTLTWLDPDRLIADLRAWGVNAAPARFAGLRTPTWWARWRDAVRGLAGPDGRIRLSIEVAYGHAFQVERTARGAALGSIGVEALRATARRRP
jgi:malonyl-CoA O-methyltransferase